MPSSSENKGKSFSKWIKAIFHSKETSPNLESKFNTIYEKNLFKGKESISGPGSDLKQTQVIIDKLPELLKRYDIKSMIDAPCGDFFWMREVNLSQVKYIGIDIVSELVIKNNSEFKSENREFISMNIVGDSLPKADVIFSRDCLVHLSNEMVRKAILNFKRSGSTYLLTTTFSGRKSNADLRNIIWRPLNLCLPPFSFPQPIELLVEECTEGNGQYSDKCLGLWKLSDLQG